MIAMLRLLVFGFLGLSIVYLAVSIYSRSVRREKLETAWDADPPEGADEAARRAYIEEGMRTYERSLRRKLIWLVYVIPICLVILVLYLTNAY